MRSAANPSNSLNFAANQPFSAWQLLSWSNPPKNTFCVITSLFLRPPSPELAVDAVHRIVTDQARITQAWVDSLEQAGMPPEKYVELLGITVTVFSIDEFNVSLLAHA